MQVTEHDWPAKAFSLDPNRASNQFSLAWGAKLIEQLHMTYGAKFLQQWQGVDKAALAQHWAQELSGFSGREIASALAACKMRSWPPTLPEFIALCRPWMDAHTAYQEAVRGMAERQKGGMGSWSHPAVYWAAARIGAYDLLNNGWQVIRHRWEATLRDALNQKQWQAIPAPCRQLAAPGKTIPGQAEADKFVAQIKLATGGGAMPAQNVTDHKAWARKICRAPKGKPMTVLTMAQRALQVE